MLWFGIVYFTVRSNCCLGGALFWLRFELTGQPVDLFWVDMNVVGGQTFFLGFLSKLLLDFGGSGFITNTQQVWE